MIDSTNDQRTENNGMRHQYRVLSDDEKAVIDVIKRCGDEFLKIFDQLEQGRETALARTKIEEAVMWPVKGVTR